MFIGMRYWSGLRPLTLLHYQYWNLAGIPLITYPIVILYHRDSSVLNMQ